MSDARKNRGTGNGGEAYRNSSFWDSVDNKSEAESEMQKAEKALALVGKAFLVDGEFVEHHRVQVLIKGEE